MASYPEHEKLAAVQPQTQAVGEFLEWLGGKGIFLARYTRGHNFPQEVHGARDLIAECFGIDQGRLEAEKREIIDAQRAANDRRA